MGDNSYRKHTRSSQTEMKLDPSHQRELGGYPYSKKIDLSDRDISIIKTVGTLLAPQCAIFISTAYSIYKNRDTLKSVTNDISEGNYSDAAKTVITKLTTEAIKHFASDLGEGVIGEVVDASVDKLEDKKVFEDVSEKVFNDDEHQDMIKGYYKKALESIINEEVG